VATQARVRVSHGDSGLHLLRNGHTAPQTLAALIAADPRATVRQIGIVDAQGNAAAHTGGNTIRYAGHQVGDGYSVQANMMESEGVPLAMATAFDATHGHLMLRILAALRAAQDAGGDFRGQQSAALKIVSGTLPTAAWDGVLYDVRVDDHADPIGELTRICHRHLAYDAADEAVEMAAQGNLEGAMARYNEALALDAEDLQYRFWFALTLADEHNALTTVEPIFREVFALAPMWKECLIRTAEAHPLNTPGMVEQILALG
ncbi:MAG: DUF1028 domain-containing protein, partial [Armatimonadetes bacterium]|nr:DUF1028 domain-containing protein [Anaerolineae bacterium]